MTNDDPKVAVITGAAAGVGRGCVQRLMTEGYRVAGIDLNESGLKKVADEAKKAGGEFMAVPFDLAQTEKIGGAVGRIIGHFGRTDVLVHCAFYSVSSEKFMDIDLDKKWDRQIRVNLGAFVALGQCCARDMMKRKWGRIIGISSVAAEKATGGPVVYTMVKGAMNSLTRSMAFELAPYGIRVNTIEPAALAGTTTYSGANDETIRALGRRLPVGRPGWPKDIAAMVSFLVSDGGDYCVGSILRMDGGYMLV
jgi:NAD(P)-dependent dehydrogenase (short-subunit alcohol dehydrogenase family)